MEHLRYKIIPYLNVLPLTLSKTPYTNPLEIIVYPQDQLVYPILDGNRLNLWDKEYDYQITGGTYSMLNFDFTYENVYEITKTISHRKCTTLALYCAQLHNTINKEAQLCIDLVQQWLDNPDSVTESQLRIAASANAAASYASYAASYAAYASYAANYAASYAANAARAAVNTKSHKSKILPYLDALTLNIPKTPYTDPLEIIVYLQDQVGVPILDGNRLNLWSTDYDYQITGSIEQIANTLGVRNLLNA